MFLFRKMPGLQCHPGALSPSIWNDMSQTTGASTLTAGTHTKGEGQSRNCKASEIVRSKTWSCQNTFPFLFAKLLMKQQHWMLFTCSFDPTRPTWQNWKYKNIQYLNNCNWSWWENRSHCKHKSGSQLGLRSRIGSKKCHQSRHHQRHSQR